MSATMKTRLQKLEAANPVRDPIKVVRPIVRPVWEGGKMIGREIVGEITGRK